MPLKGIQITNKHFPAIFAAMLFLVFSSSPVPVNAQKARTPTTAELQKKYIVTSLTKADMQIILKDAPPAARKRMVENPELKKAQVRQLREVMAIASEAVKSGLIDSTVARELEITRMEVSAINYGQRLNKTTGKNPFSAITPVQVKAFYAKAGSQARFDRYLNDKMDVLKKMGILPPDGTVPDEERVEVRDSFAKFAIYDGEAKLKARVLGAAYKRTVDLQVRLQRVRFLAKLYSDAVLADKVKVPDEEVQAYIAGHPELTAPQKAKALGILARAKASEDFAALADEFSEDPGNNDTKGGKFGGLYSDVPLGRMVKPFEQGAMALEPGQIAQGLVETDYGYHIIKLDRKGESDDGNGNRVMTYDVRHILISTTVEDSGNPGGRPVTVNDMVKTKLEANKANRVIAEIVKNNPVSVAEDFDVSAN
jgi:hypothetical protein